MNNRRHISLSFSYLTHMAFYVFLFFATTITPLSAQNITSKTVNKENANKSQPANMPPWAAAHHYDATAHAYFPDYYVYYDAKRKGYVFWENGTWSFTPALPPFLEKVDLRRSRLKLVKGLSLDLHPQRSYPRMMKMYPANQQDPLVPVPTPLQGRP